MASNACFTAFSAAAPVPILHYYGLEDYTTAKKTLISALLLKGDKVGRRGVSEGYLSAEEADNPCAVSWREQPCAVSRKEQPCAVSRKELLLSGQYLLRGRKWPTLTLPRTRNLLPQSSRTFRQGILQPKLSFPYFVFSFMLLYCILFFILFLLLLLLLLL